MTQATRTTIGIAIVLMLGAISMTIATSADNTSNEEGRRSYFEPEDRATKFQTTDQIFPSRIARAGTDVWQLGKAKLPDDFEITYEWEGKEYSVDDFNERNNTNALLILKDGEIVTEIYRNGSKPDTRLISFSMGKSFTSTLVGMALEDGYIDAVGDPLTKYLPSLIGSAYEGVTIKDALQMVSGVEWDEATYEWDDLTKPLNKHWRAALVEQRYRFIEAANELPRAAAPGEMYNYNTLESSILGWLVETVTKRRMTRYFEQRLWQPAGMEFDAAWILDGPDDIGREMSGGGLTAALRDYGRFGLMMSRAGKANGKQLVSPGWVKAATTADREPVQYGNLYEGYALGYGYQWWLFENGRFEAQGIYGQLMYVAPAQDVVIVLLSDWPEPWVDELEYRSYVFFDAVIEALK